MIRRFIIGTAVLLVAVFFVSLGVLNTALKTETHCGPWTTVPRVERYIDFAGNVGKIIHNIETGAYTPELVVRKMAETFSMIGMFKIWLQINAVGGTNEPDVVTGWRRASKEATEKALAACCPTVRVAPDSPDLAPENPTPPPFDPKSASIRTGGIPGFSTAQEHIAQTAISVGKTLDVPERGWVVAIATGFGESGLRNLNYGDRDSLGVWQQRPSMGWGSPAQIRDVKYAAASFYKGVGGNPGLLDLAGWEKMPVTVAAHKVQRNAYPNAYAKFEASARTLVAAYGGKTQPAPADTPNLQCDSQSTTTGQVIRPGGGGTVPASFNSSGNPRTVPQAMAWLQTRVDNRTPITVNQCSHYVANAYGWPNSGSPTALSLWRSIPASKKHPGQSAPPRGALVFWKTGSPAGHIAISAGNGMIYSTDVPNGRWGLVPIAKIDRWGPRQGWSDPYWPAHSGGTQA